MKKFTQHLQHYIPLLGIFIAGTAGFMFFSYDRGFQLVIVGATAASYVVWGMVHHHLHDDLHISVVIEYITIAVLGFIIIYSLLLRA